MMVNLEFLTSREKKSFEELQIRLKNALPEIMTEDDTILYRFLKARDFDVGKAEKMLRKHLNWRKSFQVDTILKDFKPKEFFLKFVVPSKIGFDRDGDVVNYSPLGKLDAREIMKCVKINPYMKHWIWYAENHYAILKQLKEKTGRMALTSYIVDLDKLTLGNATNKQTIEICLRFTRIFSDNYPEWLKYVFVVNAPAYYVVVFSIIKTVMSNEMSQKFRIFGHNGWKEKLLTFIDADVMPAFLGGNRTDPDGNPLCTTFITHGGSIPEIYFLPDDGRFFKDMSEVKKIIIPRAGKEKVYIHVTESGLLIEWEFLISSHDIGFGLFFQEHETEEMTELLPNQRYDTIDGTEIGNYRAQSSGIYVIIFDNSHSRVTSKEVEYRVTVVQDKI